MHKLDGILKGPRVEPHQRLSDIRHKKYLNSVGNKLIHVSELGWSILASENLMHWEGE